MAETTPLLRVQLLTGARGFKSLSVRHHFKQYTENPSKLQQGNLDFNDILKLFYINLRQ